jgi:hypothetical protein
MQDFAAPPSAGMIAPLRMGVNHSRRLPRDVSLLDAFSNTRNLPPLLIALERLAVSPADLLDSVPDSD